METPFFIISIHFMKKHLYLLLLILVQICSFAQEPFIVNPYLQLGKQPSVNSIYVQWQSAEDNSDWKVEYKTASMRNWRGADSLTYSLLTLSGLKTRRMYQAFFNYLEAGSIFNYRIFNRGKEVFTAEAKSLKSQDQPYRFVAVGDLGAGTPEAKKISRILYDQHPDLVVVTGDIVYEYGLASEYDSKFWPIYNANKSDSAGNPILRSVPWSAAPGNHDSETRDLDKYPDALAYFYYWNQPHNGPSGAEGVTYPALKGSEANKQQFLKAAGPDYPKMSNFSYNYGNAHWLFLDSNPSVDWTNKEMTAWVENDLREASGATWRFVIFHHPGFSSSREHFEQQQMRILAPLFEAGKVDIVFNGHVHNYQRSFPLKFLQDNKGVLLVGGKDNKTNRGRIIIGRWILDKHFNGYQYSKPEGVIYMVTGAGGQELYNPEQQSEPDTWQKFTDIFISTIHSVTVADVNGRTLSIRQVAANGVTLDAFTITK